MSLDRSLKSASSLSRHRNVLSRAERIARLTEQEFWEKDKGSVFGLPKVAHRNVKVGKKEKKKVEGAEGEAAGGKSAAKK
ncbi:MAG: small basic protein [Phycisphaerales bacterium]|nr:small basic protein [Phycisphaerales bacterium]